MLDWYAKEMLHYGFIAAREQEERVVLGEPVKFADLVLVFRALSQLVAVV